MTRTGRAGALAPARLRIKPPIGANRPVTVPLVERRLAMPSILIGADAQSLAAGVQAAGCVFVGRNSATAFGDYVAGSNHILPTGGTARFASTLSTRQFRRRMPEVRIDSEAAARLGKAGAPIALVEGFDWHARSMEARIGDNQQR